MRIAQKSQGRGGVKPLDTTNVSMRVIFIAVLSLGASCQSSRGVKLLTEAYCGGHGRSQPCSYAACRVQYGS